ncbi:ABC transporter permease protein [Butyrivibrio proteoclasticus B316]|uniref:ABC transporter permease protein n=1 Tax=Butyrivibrio proteoclasticus (strain ATCC 51982 / DSM 14932 / B316) TaxID=515622 RepID=E0RV71_BUTPB|nr:sugar ABC transporter permease [Butyrivibrio proteoclasticus]ADL34341.1 ABC transporter permease protein [Butyrivibrio proteoclasticus B316]
MKKFCLSHHNKLNNRFDHKLSSLQKKKLISWLFLLPSLLGVMLFFVAPFIVVIYYSLINNPIQKEFVGFQNYVNVWNNAAFKQAGSNTFIFSLMAVPLAVLLSLFLAAVMESRIPFKSYFRTFFLSPLMVPTASVVLIWQVMFHQNGIVNNFLNVFGQDKIDWLKSDKAYIVIVALFLWKNLGYNMILFMSALASIPKDLLEVAALENANKLQVFWIVKVRYMSSTILFVAIMSLISSFKVFREVYLMTGDYPYQTLYMLQHFMNNTFASLDYQKLSAAAIIMFIVVTVLVYAMYAVENWFGRDLEG